jgi:hypothetical protein
LKDEPFVEVDEFHGGGIVGVKIRFSSEVKDLVFVSSV